MWNFHAIRLATWRARRKGARVIFVLLRRKSRILSLNLGVSNVRLPADPWVWGLANSFFDHIPEI